MTRPVPVSFRRRLAFPAFIFVSLCTVAFLRHSTETSLSSQALFYDVDDFRVDATVADEDKKVDPIPDLVTDGPETIWVPTIPSTGPTDEPPVRPSVTEALHPDWDELQDHIYDYIQWDKPDTDHWPPWHDYDYQLYDPNRWEGMERQHGYFVNNTVEQIQRQGGKAKPYLPYPNYNSREWKEEWKGRYVACPGPYGRDIQEDLSNTVKYYPSLSNSFPPQTIGSFDALGLDQHVCFDRHARYGPYGMESPGDALRRQKLGQTSTDKDLSRTGWGRLQQSCFEMNQDRFEPHARVPMTYRPSKKVQRRKQNLNLPLREPKTPKPIATYRARTAVLLRTWEGYEYTENDLQAIRALVTELSLLSGGEYQVYLLVNVKQREADIYDDPHVYQTILKHSVPAEFRDIAVLWTERVLEDWYPKVGDWQVYWMQWMPVQWFSKTHPEFDYIWNWETDARYIGNHYHFLEQITAFAKSMPRKHLWERNSRFYIPAQHGSWEAFVNDTDEQIIEATKTGYLEPVWGPRPYAPFQTPFGPEPPSTQEEDNFEWGKGEEADLITLQPIWDPIDTQWSYRNHIWNFIPEVRPHFTSGNPTHDGFDHPGFPNIPRRVFINTSVRISRRLLDVMHHENLAGRCMQAEMWPATVALHHGFKAVYAPHPIWTDRKWPAWYVDAIFNANDNFTARWGQEIDSPYSHDREANFGGWSWYYRSVFPHVLYRRWLGWRAKDWGYDADKALEQEWNHVIESGIWNDAEAHGWQSEEWQAQAKRIEARIDVAGRMCLPGMMLHPVKNVREEADSG